MIHIWYMDDNSKKYRLCDLGSLTKFRNTLVKKLTEEQAKQFTARV